MPISNPEAFQVLPDISSSPCHAAVTEFLRGVIQNVQKYTGSVEIGFLAVLYLKGSQCRRAKGGKDNKTHRFLKNSFSQ